MNSFEDFLFILEANGKEDEKKDKKDDISELPDDFGDEDEEIAKLTKEDEDDKTGLPNDVGDGTEDKKEEPKDKMKVDTNINAKKEEPEVEPEPAKEEEKIEEPETKTPDSTDTGELGIDTPNTTTPNTGTGDLNIDTPADNTNDTATGDGDMNFEDDINLDGDSMGDDPESGDGLGGDNGMGDEEPLDDDEKAQKIKNNSVIGDIKSLYENLKLIEDTISTIVARDSYEQGIIDMTNRELLTIKDKTYDYILNVAYSKKYEENLAFLNNLRLIIELIGKNLKIIIKYRDDAEKK